MTLILYESPRRLVKTLKDMLLSWGERRVAVARELTKIHEEIFRGSISDAVEHFTAEIRGELTLVVEGAGPGPDMDSESLPGTGSSAPGPEGLNRESTDMDSPTWRVELEAVLRQGLSSKQAASAIASRFNLPRRMVYQEALAMKKSSGTQKFSPC
jgi:16S rRNA (cytidine1402-2'-O)-methyltransferase